MGNFCNNSDVYKQIKETYPQEFSQFLVGEEIKKSLTQQIDSAKGKVTSTANELQKENLGIIDSKQNQVKTHFETAKGQVQKSYLGGVKGLEQTQNAKVEDILGFTEIQKKFQNVKDDLNFKFKQEKEKAETDLAAIKKQTTDKISKDEPKVPLFDQLTDKLKSQVYESGLKDYKDQIEAQKKAVLAPLEQQIKPETWTSRFSHLLPLDSLKTLANLSKEDINRQTQKLIGSPEEGRAYLG